METDGRNPNDLNHQILPQTDTKNATPKTFWQHVREWAQVIVIALVIALPVRYFIAEPFVVNGASMDPTFSTGQFLIVDRVSYRFEQPSRGDVIVFEYPYSPETNFGKDTQYYIKRIIGLPGETVFMKDGKVSIKQASSTKAVPIDEPYIDPEHASHDTTIEKALGPTEYFVMGDNRAQSSDSRVWGPLEYHFIIGRPIVRLTPLTAITYKPGQYHENTK